MFVTLSGAYPPPQPAPARGTAAAAWSGGASARPGEPAAADAVVAAVIAELDGLGLEPISDGEVRWADPALALVHGLDGLVAEPAAARPAAARPAAEPAAAGIAIRATRLPAWRAPVLVDGWRFASGLTARAVKQALPGPYTLGRRIDAGALGRDRVTQALAEALNAELAALADAGCPLVEIQEDAAAAIGEDAGERARFTEAQQRLLDGLPDGLHRTLVVRGGSAHRAGAATIFGPAFQSYLFDLIEGPDNWNLIAAAPGDRGIVCGALDVRPGHPMGVEELIYAARYAASTQGRGLVRVGLAPAGSMTHLGHAEARSRLEILVRAAELSQSSAEVIGRAIDPRAVDARSAALGRYAPGARRPPGPVSPGVLKQPPAPRQVPGLPGAPAPGTGGPGGPDAPAGPDGNEPEP